MIDKNKIDYKLMLISQVNKININLYNQKDTDYIDTLKNNLKDIINLSNDTIKLISI